MSRRLAAIIAADMVGYSRLMAADELGTLARLKELRQEIVDPELEQAGGEIVKLTGDGMIVLFGSVVAAVEAAASVQKAIASAEIAAPAEQRITFRIGLHIGDVILDGGDVYGDGVNIAARLEAEAEPGGVILSDDAFRQVRGKTELGFVDLGELSLKNIPGPVRAHRVDLGPARPAPAGFDPLAGGPPDLPDRPSIAVLPFQNMSADAEQEYFCDGVSEDIITELSRFPELFVIARNSSFSFKGRQVTHRDIAGELGVRYMLEGSLRRAGNRVRITAQLIECTTGAHIWAERYDRDLDDIFQLQDEITFSVVGAIAPQIRQAEVNRVAHARRMDLSSYDLSLQAQALFHDGAFADRQKNDEMLEMARRAREMDPRNTHAFWLEGYANNMRYLYQLDPDQEPALDAASVAAERLIRADQSDSRGLCVRGLTHHFRQEFDKATADLLRAHDLNPNNVWALMTLAWHESLVGRTIEAREHAKMALRLSPRDTDFWVGVDYLAMAQASFADGDFEEALHWGEQAIQMTPRAPIRRALMISSFGHLGRAEDARPHHEMLVSFSPNFLESIAEGRLVLYRSAETNAQLIHGLEKAGLVQRAE